MKPITIEELYKECIKQIKKGNGEKVIMISNDDEGNGYHYMWYAFCTPEDVYLENYMLNENIAKKEATTILG